MPSLPIKLPTFARVLYMVSIGVTLAFATHPLAAQNIPVGTWRTHLTYYNARTMIEAKERLYVASQNGFFYYDRADNTLQTLSKEDGLSALNISALAFDARQDMLVVGYQDGNIDLVTDAQIVNIRTIANALAFPQKTIQNITVYDGEAFLAMPYGVSVVNLEQPSLTESYVRIGVEGSENAVYDLAIYQDSLFLATAQGLWAASLAPSVNRLDFRNWRHVVTGTGVRHLATVGTALFYTVENDGLYRYENGVSRVAPFGRGQRYRGLSAATSQLFLLMENQIIQSDEEFSATRSLADEHVRLPVAVVMEESTLWIADSALGLVKRENNSSEQLFPSGPLRPSVFRMAAVGEQIVATAGGYTEGNATPLGNVGSFYVFEEGNWSNYTAEPNGVGARIIPRANDLNDITATQGRVYFASFGDGLLTWNPASGTFDVQNALPLQNIAGLGVPLAGIAADTEGSLWVTNYGVSSGAASIHQLQPDGQWNSLRFGGFAARFPTEILVDDFNQKWVRLSGNGANGLLVFENEQRFRFIGEGFGNGGLPNANVTCMAQDRKGSLWVGTTEGVAEFFDVFSVIDGGDATLPRFEGVPLLRDEQITALAVDGGNRKWIGTLNGVWLFSEEGSQLIHHFTAANSPLLADQILDIAIQPTTGEVFFATAQGIVSYRSDATLAMRTHQPVKIFPNPVPPSFQGVISIAGLAENATVKITDAAGKLIWETQANGGTATWNGKDYNGNTASTGIYFVFSASPEGDDAFVGRIAFIR